MSRDLSNKPLVEAILEVKWTLIGSSPGPRVDPYFKLLLGRFQEKVAGEYPKYEALPTASFPDEFVGQVVQHRFRKGANQWPVLQLGPGIMTINETTDYTWSQYRDYCKKAMEVLFKSHPAPQELTIEGLTIRYIDAILFDSAKANALAFLRNKLKVDTSLPSNLFSRERVKDSPSSLNVSLSFDCLAPKGSAGLSVATGIHGGSPALLLETVVQSMGPDVPSMPSGFESWLTSAHDITDDWFFKLIEGDLEKQFSQ